MKKHLLPDRAALPRLPYRLLKENWWLEEDFTFDTDNGMPFKRRDGTKNMLVRRVEVRACN